MNYIKVTIKDKQTLILESDAKKGDLINLSDLMHVDITKIEESIDNAANEVFLKREQVLTKQLELQHENELSKRIRSFELKNQELIEQLKNIEELTKSHLALKHQEDINNFNKKIQSLENHNNELLLNSKNKLDLLNLQFEKRIIDEKQKLNDELNKNIIVNNDLKNQLETIKELNKLESNTKLMEVKQEYDKKNQELTDELDNLKRQKSSLNVKLIGEDLETWCDNEFNQTNLIVANNIVWQKDNEVIKGSKADFIYKVYATEEKLDEHLLTSVILEMKSEDPLAPNKQDLKAILKELDKDRNNKEMEYAVLVSELNYGASNDLPIRKVNEYNKMFIVRPQYFLTLLNIITAFGMKYQDILLDRINEKIKFKDLDEILEEFELMKDDILNKSIVYIEKQLEIIFKQTESISKANEKIIESTNVILNSHLRTVVNKINSFKINKITKNIDEL